MIILLAICFACLNALRGSGVIDRMTCALLMGIVAAGIADFHLPNVEYVVNILFITLLGMYSGLVCSWGKYLNIFSGNMEYVDEIGVPPIDWITNKLCGKPTNPAQFMRWCFVALTLRGLLFYPVFVVLALYNQKAFIYGVGCGLMGVCYYIAKISPLRWQVRTGEFLYGGLIGGLIGLSL